MTISSIAIISSRTLEIVSLSLILLNYFPHWLAIACAIPGNVLLLILGFLLSEYHLGNLFPLGVVTNSPLST